MIKFCNLPFVLRLISHLACILKYVIPIVNPSDDCPCPILLAAETATLMSLEDKQTAEGIVTVKLQTSSLQDNDSTEILLVSTMVVGVE